MVVGSFAMEEGDEVVGCGRKRGRDETQIQIQTKEDLKPQQEKKSRGDCFYSCLLALESPDLEEDLVCAVDEEHVYNLMKELMEEIGMEANPPTHETSVPLACLADKTTYSSCNLAASSAPNGPSKVANSMKMEPTKSVVKKKDYYVREDFAEVTSKRGVLLV